MTAEEQALEKVFLSALRKHFNKPGPWLPNEKKAGNEKWPSAQGVPEGEVWEVFVGPTTTTQTFSLNGIALNTAPNTIIWLPGFGVTASAWPFDLIDPATGAVTYLGNPPSVSVSNRLITSSEGWLLCGKDFITSTIAYTVRARRRFDLEE